jgi:hypothetical protein
MKKKTKQASSTSRDREYELLIDLFNLFVYGQRQLAKRNKMKEMSWGAKLKYIQARNAQKSTIRMYIDLAKFIFKTRSEIKIFMNASNELSRRIVECAESIDRTDRLKKIYP